MIRRLLPLALLTSLLPSKPLAAAEVPAAGAVVPLDGQWLLATDAANVGRQEAWHRAARPEAKPAKVPWIIQEAFPGYHGVVWYWREFVPAANPHPQGLHLLRFWAVDYLAEVWLNGTRVGGHEGGETPFTLDVTGAIRPGEKNLLAVRVLNPTHERIDGIVLNETARRCKVIPFGAGAIFNHGGITDSVELLAVPPVRIDDLWVVARPGPKTAALRVRVQVTNAATSPRRGWLEIAAAPARSGETLSSVRLDREFPAGQTLVEAELAIDNPRLWDLNDPYLYRVTARARTEGTGSFDERSARCGFRDFRLADGYFRLNGRRIYLRSSHTCNHYPIGIQFPQDPDMLRRDLINMKVMGFNAIRFIWGGASRAQLDLCDEIGLLVYEESYASMPIADSPKMAERFDTAVSELIRRDRNHPCIVMWGLLNESSGGPDFRHAVAMLPRVRSLDDTRVVLLNSGRYDHSGGGGGIAAVAGLKIWPKFAPTEPWVAVNATDRTLQALGITWPAGALALHPGPKNEYSALRWKAPAAGEARVAAVFAGIAERATTDVHVLHNGRAVFDAALNLKGAGNEARFSKPLALAAGDTLDFVVGSGNEHYGADSTSLAISIEAAGRRYDAAKEFSVAANPNGPWTCGLLAPGAAPDAATFAAHPAEAAAKSGPVGSIANPGSDQWQDILSDRHVYPRVPHTAEIVQSLRALEAKEQPVFLSEYGIGSAVDLWRAVRHFEQRRAEGLEDAQFFRAKLNQFLADWNAWRLDEAFARPEDFFMESLKKMAPQRTLGLNAIRANPRIIGHSLTGAIDHVMCGEGLTTLFRELKPGTIDAMADAWAPLRWCLFAEPVHAARGSKVRLEAVLANEDALPPGDYPVRLQVVGPDVRTLLDKTITVRVPKAAAGAEPPLARLCFSEDLVVEGPSGKYRFLATFLRGAAAAGGEAEFHVSDPAEMPAVGPEVVLWGEDPDLARWLAGRGIRARPFAAAPAAREVILGSTKPPAPGGAEVFRELATRVARGSTVVFLAPEVFARGENPTAWLPLAKKGSLTPIHGWLYLKDEWSKRHPIFEGMPSGGLMDYGYYREIIPDLVWTGQEPPAEAVAGAIKASQDYASGLMLAVYRLGEGKFVLNTLRIRENLGGNPAAERLLRNLLRYAAADASKPLGNLPDDFAAQVKAMGY